MENMRMKTDGDDANGSRFRGKVKEQEVKEQAVKEIQLGCQKLSLGKVRRSPKNPNAIKPRKNVQFRPRGKKTSSRTEPIALKPLKDLKFRSCDKRPWVQAMKHEIPVVNLSWADMDKYMGDDEEVVIGPVDKRDLDEAMERNEEPDELYFRLSESMRRAAHEYATAAISYMREKGHNLELVKPCLHSSGAMTKGFRAHFNFKAKRADDPSAPVETYFGQLRFRAGSGMVVECCVSLGVSDSLPYKRDNRGCQYCYDFVHHPVGGCKGIIWGHI